MPLSFTADPAPEPLTVPAVRATGAAGDPAAGPDTGPTAAAAEPSAGPTPAEPATVGPGPATVGPEPGAAARDDRQVLLDALLNELSGFGPRERMGMLKSWHRGALSLVHLNVLTVLEAEGPLSMSRLAEALDVSVASATGIVDRMERRCLVLREHGSQDRRIVVVRQTDGGAAVFSALAAHRRERLTQLLGELNAEELAGFLSGVRAMRAAGTRLFGDTPRAFWAASVTSPAASAPAADAQAVPPTQAVPVAPVPAASPPPSTSRIANDGPPLDPEQAGASST